MLWLQYPRLGDNYRIDEDFRYFYQINRFQDPELYQNNYLRPILNLKTLKIFGAEIPIYINAPVYSLLLYFSGFFISPFTFLQLLPFILFPIAALYAYKFGQSVHSRRIGEILAVGLIILNLVSPSSLSVLPGLARSFVIPLVIAMIYYMRQQQFLPMIIIGILSALIYPPLFVLLAITWGLYTLSSIWKTKPEIKTLKRSLIYLILTIFLSFLVQ